MRRHYIALLGCILALALAAPARAEYAALEGWDFSWGLGDIYITGDDASGSSADQEFELIEMRLLSQDYVITVFGGWDWGVDSFIYGALADVVLAGNYTEASKNDGRYYIAAGGTFVGFDDLYPDENSNGFDDYDYGPNIGFIYEKGRWTVGLTTSYLVDTESYMLNWDVGYDFFGALF